MLKLVEFVDRRKKRGGDHKSEKFRNQKGHVSFLIGETAKETARILDTSDRKVKEARTVLDHADPKLREEIEQGKKSITRQHKKLEKISLIISTTF